MPILNWLSRDQAIGAAKGVSYRLLEEASELSAGDPNTGNMLIQGDNLEALKALLPFYARPSEVHLYFDSARIRRPPLPNGAIRILPNG